MKKSISLLFIFIMAVGFIACNDVPTGIDREQPEAERLTITGDMPFANGVFSVLRNQPANFSANASPNFISFTWWPRFNTNPTDSFHFPHKDFTNTWGANGTYTLKLRGYRNDNTFKDTTYTVNVLDSIPGGLDTAQIFSLISSTQNTSTGKYNYHFKIGSSYSKYFSHIPPSSNYKPGLVVRTENSYKVIPITGSGLDTADKHWDLWVEMHDSLTALHVVRWYDTLQNPATWHHANLAGSMYYRDWGNGNKFLSVGLKTGAIMTWNQFTYTRPGNQGDIHWAWESDFSGANRIVYFDIRELSFTNLNQIYWISTLINHGMNVPKYDLQAMGSTGYARLTIPMSSIPVADSGTVFLNVGKPFPGNLIPSIDRTMFKFYHNTYGLCIRLQFFQGLDKPGNKNKK